MSQLFVRTASVLAPRAAAQVPRASRPMSTAGVSEPSVLMEIGIGCFLGTVGGGAYMLFAKGQFDRMDAFNKKLATSKK